MTLSDAIRERQARRAVKANRDRNEAAGRRADEIASVHEVGTDYAKVDRAGDVAIEGHFQQLYALVDSKPEKDAVLAAYLVWVALRAQRGPRRVGCRRGRQGHAAPEQRVLAGRGSVSHMRQHSGWATAAKRRGESLLACSTCGMVHARNLNQAAPEPVHETPMDFAKALAVAVLLVAAGIAMTIAVAGYAA